MGLCVRVDRSLTDSLSLHKKVLQLQFYFNMQWEINPLMSNEVKSPICPLNWCPAAAVSRGLFNILLDYFSSHWNICL